MIPKDILKHKLSGINGKDYGAYQSLLGEYDFEFFKLIVQQIPKDPYAPPHTGVYRIVLPRKDDHVINYTIQSKTQKIAFGDFLARHFYEASRKISGKSRGTGYSGIITINQPGQAVLDRNSVVVSEDFIEVRCFIGLPAKMRIIKSPIAEKMLFDELPQIVRNSLLKENIDQQQLTHHIKTVEDAEFLRSQLAERNLISFIANNSLLPRQSGTSDKPLATNEVVMFAAPQSLEFEFDLPYAGLIKGMGIPRGITLIAGGGYHGKSTLLNVIEQGIYNHVPGDGREQCVSVSESVKIRAYSGRSVIKTDISSFIKNLPLKKDTKCFSTQNASGSTSQAASIVEAVEAGAKVLLMDEDTCATNFMIRDAKMQKLVHKKDEPITTYIDKVKQLYEEKGISTVLVLGGVGDYFDVADNVIQMKSYKALNVTQQALQISHNFTTKRLREDEKQAFRLSERIPIAESVSALNEHGKFRIYAKEIKRIHFGKNEIDLTDLEQLKELSQTKALAFALEYSKKYMNKNVTLRELASKVIRDIEDNSLDILTERVSGHFAAFRLFELIFTFNRLRAFDISQEKN